MGGVAPGEATIRNVLLQLDDLFDEIATDLNALQATGRDLNGNIPVVPNNDILAWWPARIWPCSGTALTATSSTTLL
ncbi:MAG: hypothetical protein R2857_05290 [Vampirovibrionales bacterium]